MGKLKEEESCAETMTQAERNGGFSPRIKEAGGGMLLVLQQSIESINQVMKNPVSTITTVRL